MQQKIKTETIVYPSIAVGTWYLLIFKINY